jgi:hypothetical protein
MTSGALRGEDGIRLAARQQGWSLSFLVAGKVINSGCSFRLCFVIRVRLNILLVTTLNK